MSRTRSQTALLFTARVTLLILTASSPVYVQPRPRQAANPEPEIVLKQLQDRLSRGQPWDDVRVGVSCFNNSGHRAVTIFGRGIGIWNQRAQFFLDPERVHSVLELLRKGEFLKMKESYGGPPNQTSGALAVSVTCRIDLSVSRLRKSSMQRRKGEQSAKLKQLANQILDLCEGPARSAVGIDSLSAGLQKLRDGSLAPETFSLPVRPCLWP